MHMRMSIITCQCVNASIWFTKIYANDDGQVVDRNTVKMIPIAKEWRRGKGRQSMGSLMIYLFTLQKAPCMKINIIYGSILYYLCLHRLRHGIFSLSLFLYFFFVFFVILPQYEKHISCAMNIFHAFVRIHPIFTVHFVCVCYFVAHIFQPLITMEWFARGLTTFISNSFWIYI